MNKLLIGTIALVTVFSMPASAAPGYPHPPRFRAIPDVTTNTEANPEQRQSTEQRNQSRDVIGQASDPELR
jgi:hypothetical protein